MAAAALAKGAPPEENEKPVLQPSEGPFSWATEYDGARRPVQTTGMAAPVGAEQNPPPASSGAFSWATEYDGPRVSPTMPRVATRTSRPARKGTSFSWATDDGGHVVTSLAKRAIDENNVGSQAANNAGDRAANREANRASARAANRVSLPQQVREPPMRGVQAPVATTLQAPAPTTLEARVATARAKCTAAIDMRARELAQAAVDEYMSDQIDEEELKQRKEGAHAIASAGQRDALALLDKASGAYSVAKAARVAAAEALARAIQAENEVSAKVDEALRVIEQ